MLHNLSFFRNQVHGIYYIYIKNYVLFVPMENANAVVTFSCPNLFLHWQKVHPPSYWRVKLTAPVAKYLHVHLFRQQTLVYLVFYQIYICLSLEEDCYAKKACTTFFCVCMLEKLSHPEGKWFKSENERSQLQLLDVWNGSWVQLSPTDNT